MKIFKLVVIQPLILLLFVDLIIFFLQYYGGYFQQLGDWPKIVIIYLAPVTISIILIYYTLVLISSFEKRNIKTYQRR